MYKSKAEIIVELKESFQLLDKAAKAVPEQSFNLSKEDKWTTAENISHLVTSTKITALAFTLPKFLHVLLYGKAHRTSHAYSKLVDTYEKKLAEGAKATGAYVPKNTNYEQQKLTAKLASEADKLVNAVSEKWNDEQLDHYRVKHPILGLLTLRELAYFTIYHNGHHLATIRKYYMPE